MVLSKKANNKGPDQNGHMCRLVCAFVVREPFEDRFSCVKAHILVCKFSYKECSSGFVILLSQIVHPGYMSACELTLV